MPLDEVFFAKTAAIVLANTGWVSTRGAQCNAVIRRKDVDIWYCYNDEVKKWQILERAWYKSFKKNNINMRCHKALSLSSFFLSVDIFRRKTEKHGRHIFTLQTRERLLLGVCRQHSFFLLKLCSVLIFILFVQKITSSSHHVEQIYTYHIEKWILP